MNTTEILISRARRSIARWQAHETERNAHEARVDCITVAVAQAIDSMSLLGLDENAHTDRVTRLAHLVVAGDEAYAIVDRWFDESPDDDVVEQLRSALGVVEGGEVMGAHWLRAGAPS